MGACADKTGGGEKVRLYGDATDYGKADHNLQEEADGAADHGGVEVFERS